MTAKRNETIITTKKKVNFRNFEETQIYTKDYINCILGEKNRTIMPIIVERGSFATAVDKKTQQAFTFSFYEDKITDYEDIKAIIGKANGWYSAVKRWAFKDYNLIKMKDIPVEGPWAQLNPEEFPNIQFKYLNKTKIEGVTCLDLNSAYLSILAKGYYPDLSTEREDGFVQEGEIGFSFWTGTLKRVKVGEYADKIFKLSYNKNLEKWAKDKYSHLCLLKSQKNEKEADAFKASITRMTGIIRNHNPYLYIYIVNSCKQKIAELVDENCVNIVTDAITFVGKVNPSLNIGNKLGQFKIEYEDCVLYREKAPSTNVYIEDRAGNIIKKAYKGGSTPKEAIEGFDKEGMKFQIREKKYNLLGDTIYDYK